METNNAKLFGRIAAVMAAVRRLDKDGTNRQSGYDYVSSDNALTVIGKAMADNGLVIIPMITDVQSTTEGEGKRYTRTRATMEMHICDSDGNAFASRWAGEGVDYGNPDKALNKAISYAVKYFLLKLFVVGAGDDDPDAESAPPPVHQVAPKTTQKAPVHSHGQNDVILLGNPRAQLPPTTPAKGQASSPPENPFDDDQIVSQDGPAYEGTPPHRHFWGQGLRTFGPDEWGLARPWLLRKYTEKTTPRNIRSSAADLSDDEKTQIAEYMRDNEVALQQAWERQKKINAAKEA